MGEFIPPQPLDVMRWVTVRLHANGTISTSGTIGDKKLTLHMLDQARQAVKDRIKEYKALVIPNGQVELSPVLPVKDMGYIPEHQRGDP